MQSRCLKKIVMHDLFEVQVKSCLRELKERETAAH